MLKKETQGTVCKPCSRECVAMVRHTSVLLGLSQQFTFPLGLVSIPWYNSASPGPDRCQPSSWGSPKLTEREVGQLGQLVLSECMLPPVFVFNKVAFP